MATFFGQISYSLYLYHWPIAVALSYYFVDEIPIVLSLVGIGVGILLSWVSYSLIEYKFRYALSFRLQ